MPQAAADCQHIGAKRDCGEGAEHELRRLSGTSLGSDRWAFALARLVDLKLDLQRPCLFKGQRAGKFRAGGGLRPHVPKYYAERL